MSFHNRIRTVYTKELIDILRDRRTLIAMIVVPIVLYPLLMLGSIQAVSLQTSLLAEEAIIVGVVGEAQKNSLIRLIQEDVRAAAERSEQPADDARDDAPPPKRLDELVRIDACESVEQIDEKIRNRQVHVGVVFDHDVLIDSPDAQNIVNFRADFEEVHSLHAAQRLEQMIERIAERTRSKRKADYDLPALFDKPFTITTEDLSSPPSVLGQILPLILILMTITGAIYPAIDLTAGERERGTLESLMVCPVPVIDLIVGKFLVVTTVAIMGAALNLGSVSATVYFGGFDKALGTGGGIPLSTMGLILLCLIPFAVLMSAIMIAVCSFARTFKEAQNYVTPVILAVLVPGGIAALPTTTLDGVMLVMPVGNMVLLTRELLLGAVIPPWHVGIVLISTTLYASAAVAVAAGIFGKETVVFSDTGSLRQALSRRLIKPTSCPAVSTVLLFTSLLFPAWFFVQASLSPDADSTDASQVLYGTSLLLPLLFVVLPAALLAYRKVNLAETFALRLPELRHQLGAVLIGASAWVLAHEVNVLQQAVIGVPEAVLQQGRVLAETLGEMPLSHVLMLIAVVPAVCEELLFRGFLLSGLRGSAGKWTSILVSATIFGIFHFFVFKFPVTAGLGVVLGYLCWQSKSILPAMIMHLLHNGIGAISAVRPQWMEWIVPVEGDVWAHLPTHILIGGGLVFVAGIALVSGHRAERAPASAEALVAVRPAAPK